MSHDYLPEWNYLVTKPSNEDKIIIDKIAAEISKDILPYLGLNPFSVFCVEEGDLGKDLVGIYIDGTSSAPVLGLDLFTLKSSSEEYGVSWIDQVKATIVHELAHAYEETTGSHLHDEGAVENFARAYVMEGVADMALLQPVHQKKTKKNSKTKP
jgi:hypothetical protein